MNDIDEPNITPLLLWVQVPGGGTVEMKPIDPGYEGPTCTLTVSPNGEATLTIGEDAP